MSILDNIRKSIPEIKQRITDEAEGKEVGSLQDAVDIFNSTTYIPKLKSSEYLKSALGWIYGCVNVIADEVAMIELKLCKNTNGEITEIDDHPALDVLYKPNNAMTRFDFIQLTFQYLELTGEAPWYVKYNGNKVSGFILLRPDRLTVLPGKNGELVGGYKYRVYGDTGVQELSLDPQEVIFLKYSDPDNPVRGKGPLQAAATTVDLDNYSEKWNSQFFKNSGAPNAVLQTDKKLGKEALARVEKKLKDKFQGLDNAHKTMVLESGLKWEKISLSQKDMDFVEQQRFSRDKMLAIFRVPKTALGLTEDVNRANAEATDYVFAKRTIKPKMQRFTEQLDIFLLALFPNTDNIYFDFKDPIPENVEQNIAKAQSGVQTGYMTINEAREIADLDPIEGGDVLRDPTSFQPVAPNDPNQNSLSYTKGKRKPKPYHKHLYNSRTRKTKHDETKKKFIEKAVSETVTAIVYDHLKRNSVRESQVDFFVKSARKSILMTGTHEEVKKGKYDFQEKQLKVADEFEGKMISKLNKVFRDQKEIILRGLDNGTKLKLNESTETEKYQEALRPVYIPMMKEQAGLSFQLLGVQKDYFASEKAKGLSFTQRLIEYFDNRIIKLAPEITAETNSKLTAAFALAAEKEESIPQIKRRISELFGGMEGYRSERIARTETIRGSNFATQEAYVESGVVEAKEWLATKDERTDDECLEKDGTVIPLKGAFQGKSENGYERVEFPPIHVNCRCTLIPVISTPLKEGEWRSSMNAQQADAFIKDSKIKNTYYHGTTEKSANNIMKNGFNVSQNNIGEGVYMTNIKSDAEKYANALDHKTGTVVNLKVRAKTVKRFASSSDFIEAVEEKFGTITDAAATKYLAQYDAVEIKDIGYLIVPDPRNVVALRPKY